MEVKVIKSFESGEVILKTHLNQDTPNKLSASRIIGSKVHLMVVEMDHPITHNHAVTICNLDDDTFKAFAGKPGY